MGGPQFDRKRINIFEKLLKVEQNGIGTLRILKGGNIFWEWCLLLLILLGGLWSSQKGAKNFYLELCFEF